jgi:hypothetical protein
LRYAGSVSLHTSSKLAHGVTTKLPLKFRRKGNGHHLLANHRGGRHGANIRTLPNRLSGLTRSHVDGAKWSHERRDRFHGTTHPDRLAVAHPALDSTRSIGIPANTSVIAHDLIV